MTRADETRSAPDVVDVIRWIKGGPVLMTVAKANFQATRLLTMRIRNSTAYKGLYALVMKDGALDLRTGEPIDVQAYFDENTDINHIFA